MPYDRLIFRVASKVEEFDQVHRLNYRTFVEEIPQHPPNREKKLVDKFHHENTYLLCLDGQKVVGMLALRANRPFSLDAKVADLDSYLPTGASVCEFRLLAVDAAYRKPGVFARLIRFAAGEAIRRGHTLAVASGTVRQTRLYRRMGFVPFSSQVGSDEARYQPMYLTLTSARALFERLGDPCPELPAAVSFMPGPVEISAAVQQAVGQPPSSHRGAPFLAIVADVKRSLTALTGAAGVELLLGSGTLGNDVVAAQLKRLPGRGVILSNGEFGERLVDHARRMGLDFELLRYDWGEAYDLLFLESFLRDHPGRAWLWTVHCETSTGVLNDLPRLQSLCSLYQVRLCIDATSSLGTVDVDLSGVYLASSVSGKGLASFPGISLVFSNHRISPDERLPRYLDLGYYRQNEGVPFTQSSNLVAALRQALLELKPEERFAAIRELSARLRGQLQSLGFVLLGSARDGAPAVLSIVLPKFTPSQYVGAEMESRGWMLSYRSSYLLERNIIQICLLGRVTAEQCLQMVQDFAEIAAGGFRVPENQLVC